MRHEHVAEPGDGRPFSIIGIAVRGGRIAEIDIVMDPQRLARLDLSSLDELG
jgi:RNA polymerase sigma-70 factor (ECF subfamily)